MSKTLQQKWSKRTMKIKGAMWYLSSALMMRYTKWNAKQLANTIAQQSIDQLHVGCGDVILPGWLNILFEKRQEYGRLQSRNNGWFLNYNLLQEWPVASDSISYIAGSHFIEHIDLNAGLKFAKESFRVMKKGGVIRLSCPDLERYAKNYVERNQSFFDHEKIREWCAFKNAQTPGEIFIAKAYDSGGAHKWFYDFESLSHILEEAGFSQVKRVSRLEGDVPDLEQLEPPDRELETIYVEAIK